MTSLISGTFLFLLPSSVVYWGWCYLARLPQLFLLPQYASSTSRVLSTTCSVSLNETSEKLPFLQAGRVSTAPALLSLFWFWACISWHAFDSKCKRVMCNGITLIYFLFVFRKHLFPSVFPALKKLYAYSQNQRSFRLQSVFCCQCLQLSGPLELKGLIAMSRFKQGMHHLIGLSLYDRAQCDHVI